MTLSPRLEVSSYLRRRLEADNQRFAVLLGHQAEAARAVLRHCDQASMLLEDVVAENKRAEDGGEDELRKLRAKVAKLSAELTSVKADRDKKNAVLVKAHRMSMAAKARASEEDY